MSLRIVGVHGSGNHFLGGELAGRAEMGRTWTASVRSSLQANGVQDVSDIWVEIAYWASAFGSVTSSSLERAADSVTLVPAKAAGRRGGISLGDLATLAAGLATGRTAGKPRRGVGDLSRRLGHMRARDLLPGDAQSIIAIEEIARHLASGRQRSQSRNIVIRAIETMRPAVVLAHSLGSVIAYEALCRVAPDSVKLLVTMGSPLGEPRAVFPALSPPPVDGRGQRPRGARNWVNVSDPTDPICFAPQLAPLFDGVDLDVHPRIGPPGSHAAELYLKDPIIGRLLALFLPQGAGGGEGPHE